MVSVPEPTTVAVKRFYRTTRTDCKLAGVCGGVARYLEMDPTLVRILWVILTFAGPGLIAYVVFWIAAPSEDTLDPPPPAPAATVYR